MIFTQILVSSTYTVLNVIRLFVLIGHKAYRLWSAAS